MFLSSVVWFFFFLFLQTFFGKVNWNNFTAPAGFFFVLIIAASIWPEAKQPQEWHSLTEKPLVLFIANLVICLFDWLALDGAVPKTVAAGSSATLLFVFGGILGFTKGDYCNPTGNARLFIRVVQLKGAAHGCRHDQRRINNLVLASLTARQNTNKIAITSSLLLWRKLQDDEHEYWYSIVPACGYFILFFLQNPNISHKGELCEG